LAYLYVLDFFVSRNTAFDVCANGITFTFTQGLKDYCLFTLELTVSHRSCTKHQVDDGV